MKAKDRWLILTVSALVTLSLPGCDRYVDHRAIVPTFLDVAKTTRRGVATTITVSGRTESNCEHVSEAYAETKDEHRLIEVHVIKSTIHPSNAACQGRGNDYRLQMTFTPGTAGRYRIACSDRGVDWKDFTTIEVIE